MTSTGDKITALGAKLSKAEMKLSVAQAEYNSVRNEIENILFGDQPVTLKTTTKANKKVSPKKSENSLGNQIYNYLMNNPGQPLEAIGSGLNVAAQKIGVSAWHLVSKGKVYTDNGLYYATPAVS